MNLSNEFNPVPKPQAEKRQPKVKNKRPAKKRKKNPLKQEVYKGRIIPTKQQRGKITAKEYNEALRRNGEGCFFCGSPNIEMHHVMPKGYSKQKNGRGVWRNLRALCPEHHRGATGVHQNREMMERLQAEHEKVYGPYYYMDRFDLFKMGLIPNTEKESFEEFMREQEKRD